MTVGTFNVGADYGAELDSDYISSDPYWLITVVRLGVPLSFSRKKMASVTKDVSLGGMTRAETPLVISDDCVNISISNNKRSHLKTLNATLKQTDVNYLTEILPGDHCLAFLVSGKQKYESLLYRLERSGEPCNNFDDGLKFVGRVHSVRKQVQVSRESGIKTAQYSLQCSGFSELDTQLFYDNSLASKDVLSKDLGQWLVRLGIEYEKLFSDDAINGIKQNNINQIVPTLLDLIVGKGPDKGGNILVDGAGGKTATATPSLDNSAPYSYLIPLQVGKILGVNAGSKAARVMAYADILELVQGVQKYPNKEGYKVFIPSLKDGTARRRVTPIEMLGTFLPFFPELTNQPLWSVMNRYLNPTINEMFTSLRVNPEGRVMPTITMRQIPFTTEAFDPGATSAGNIAVTRFVSDMPRWQIPPTMVYSVDIGRSDATRFNFVHIYGQSSYAANNNPTAFQIVENPPVRDDLDIMRSGLKPYMATVECWVDDQIGKAPSVWMNLVADWTIGSHLTLNGSITTLGIQSPICEGDNVEFDGVVYHIEGVTHQAGMNGSNKSWTTTLQLTNGMRVDGGTDEEREAAKIAPIYPGFNFEDNKGFDPGLSLEQRLTTGGAAKRNTDYDDNGMPIEPPPFVPVEK